MKTVYLIFHRSRIKTPHIYHDVSIDDTSLTLAYAFKYLGVIIDSNIPANKENRYESVFLQFCMNHIFTNQLLIRKIGIHYDSDTLREYY